MNLLLNLLQQLLGYEKLRGLGLIKQIIGSLKGPYILWVSQIQSSPSGCGRPSIQ
jgi:hypothetical protein